MTEAQQRQAVRKFIADWAGHGDEKQDTSRFWMGLLRNVFGIEEPEKFMEFELPVKLAHTSFIDGYIPQTRVLIEQRDQLQKGIEAIRRSTADTVSAGPTLCRVSPL